MGSEDRNPDRLDHAHASGEMLITISLETSMKKLVRLAAHTLRGNVRQVAFDLDSAVIRLFFSFRYDITPIGRECWDKPSSLCPL